MANNIVLDHKRRFQRPTRHFVPPPPNPSPRSSPHQSLFLHTGPDRQGSSDDQERASFVSARRSSLGVSDTSDPGWAKDVAGFVLDVHYARFVSHEITDQKSLPIPPLLHDSSTSP